RITERAVGLLGPAFSGENKAIDVTAEAQGEEPERPAGAACGGGCRRETVDGELLDPAWIGVFHPAGLEIIGQRLLCRHAHHIQTQRFITSVLEAEHRLCGVVEREARWRHEAEAELGMQEVPPAREPFAWVLAVDQAVEGGEII